MAHTESSVAKTPTKSYGNDDFSRMSSYEWYGPGEDDDAKAARRSAKTDFMANHDVRYPELGFPMLDALDMDSVEKSYQKVLADLMAAEDSDDTNRSYEHSGRKLAELYRHKEILRRLGWSANVALSRERAGNMTLELFGEIEHDDFAHLVGGLRARAESISQDSLEARELLQMVGSMETPATEPNYEITATAIERFRGDLYEMFPGLETIVGEIPHTTASVEEKATYMQQVIDCVCREASVSLILTEGSTAASANIASRQITIGRDRLEGYSGQQALKTSLHEAIGHMVRGLRAENKTAEPLREAQSGNLAFEEGLATAIEQIVTGETRIAGEQYYLSLGLQLGLDRGGQKRDFRDTFEIMWRRLIVTSTTSGNPITTQEARDKAYTQIMRTNRGGAVDARDISYFNGSKYAYPWLNATAQLDKPERQKALTIVLSGRFDATDPVQWETYEQSYTREEIA